MCKINIYVKCFDIMLKCKIKYLCDVLHYLKKTSNKI